MGFKCLLLIIASHQSTIQEKQFCKDSHQELSGKRGAGTVRAKARGMVEPGMIQE